MPNQKQFRYVARGKDDSLKVFLIDGRGVLHSRKSVDEARQIAGQPQIGAALDRRSNRKETQING